MEITATAVQPDVERVSWTEQSDKLLAITEGMNDVGDISPAGAAWVVSVADPAHPSQIKSAPATIGATAWSQNGSQIYFAQSKADAPPGVEDLYEMTVADGSIRDLSDGFSGSMGHDEPIAEEGRFWIAELGFKATLVRWDGTHSEPLHFDTATVLQFNTNAKHSAWVWLGSSSDKPTALFYAEKLGDAAKTLNTPNLLPAEWTEIASQPVSWKSDALTIEGLLYLPPQAVKGKVPLVVDVHGGPTGAFEDNWNALTEFLLGQGWAVLRTNPRGSTGYGAAFAAANKNDMGGGDYRDIMTGVDTMLAKYPIDAGKMALMGYSYGGEMAGFVEGGRIDSRRSSAAHRSSTRKANTGPKPARGTTAGSTEGIRGSTRRVRGSRVRWPMRQRRRRRSCCCRGRATRQIRWGRARKCIGHCDKWGFRW